MTIETCTQPLPLRRSRHLFDRTDPVTLLGTIPLPFHGVASDTVAEKIAEGKSGRMSGESLTGETKVGCHYDPTSTPIAPSHRFGVAIGVEAVAIDIRKTPPDRTKPEGFRGFGLGNAGMLP